MSKIVSPSWIFTTPLHGVRLYQSADTDRLDCDGEYIVSIKLSFSECFVPTQQKSIWRLSTQGERYSSVVELFDDPTGKLLHIECQGTGSFQYQGNEINVAWRDEGTSFEHYLQTVGLSLWLEMRGILCIHANAIETERGVIGIIAPSQTGKTTLTAALAVRGMGMMSDDMMAIHKTTEGLKVFPGWPQVRMWPEVAQHFVRDIETLQRVHHRFEKRIVESGTQSELRFSSKSGRLKRLYLLDRTDSNDSEIRIEQLSASESMIVLLQNSMLADAYRSLNVEKDRLDRLASMLESVEIKRITYPSGKEHLVNICKSIEADVKTI